MTAPDDDAPRRALPGRPLLALAAAALALPSPRSAQQLPDTAYRPAVESPTFTAGAGPVVSVDAAHLNFHTADGGYRAFAELLRRDGYIVRENRQAFSARALEGVDVLVVANALHRQSEAGWSPLPNLSAFTDPEIAELEAWVAAGGSLMLVADHMPLAGHAEALAAAFGIRFYNGFAMDAAGGGRATFRRSDGSLRPGPLGAAAAVDSVTSFTGQAFRVDPGIDAQPLLVFPDGYSVHLPRVAWELTDSTPRVPAAHLLQGVLVRHGRGRVAAFGEAAMFTAQLAGPQRVPVGMNHPAAAQNGRFALGVLRWLAGSSR